MTTRTASIPTFGWVSLMLMLFLFAGCVHNPSGENRSGEQPAVTGMQAPPGGDFTLSSSGGPISLRDFRGKVVLLFFGYASCPDVCPTSLALSAKALESLGKEELSRVQPLFITLDPERDTTKQLAEFVSFFHPKFIGLSGSAEEVARVAGLYGVKYYQVELEGAPGGYAVNHSAAIYLIAPDGSLRFLFPHGTSPRIVARAIRYLLAASR